MAYHWKILVLEDPAARNKIARCGSGTVLVPENVTIAMGY
jgi:hypothetical protein